MDRQMGDHMIARRLAIMSAVLDIGQTRIYTRFLNSFTVGIADFETFE